MIGLLHLPEPDERTVWFPGGQGTTSWRVWTKPRGVSMVSILAIGSGGGGGGGGVGGSGSTASGGAPGAGAPMVKMLFPAWMLPDRLYVFSAYGGVGGVSNNNGANGEASRVSVYPSSGNNLIISTNNGGRGGLASGTSQAALAGATAITAPLGQMAATQLFVAGTATGAGSTGTTSSVTPVVICPGGGGGGKTTGAGGAGAGYAAVADTLLNAVPGGTGQTGAGASSGFIHAGIHYGGCGGGGNNLGVGGRGGNGVAWGAGGGGGGGGLTGGRGGDGGPGLVIIASW
jgi:hypothetical protein